MLGTAALGNYTRCHPPRSLSLHRRIIINSEQTVMTSEKSRQPPLNVNLIQVLYFILHILGRLIHAFAQKRTRVGSRPRAAFISSLKVTQQVWECCRTQLFQEAEFQNSLRNPNACITKASVSSAEMGYKKTCPIQRSGVTIESVCCANLGGRTKMRSKFVS